VLSGKDKGNMVFIPRITLTPSSEELPFPLSHSQFSVHLAFLMTINKSQGQFVTNVGLDLHTRVFSHDPLC
jgi:ATP-dependent DNA helicase PIF1